MSMNPKTMMAPKMPEVSPLLMESWPRLAPTVMFWMISTGAGRAPTRRTNLRSRRMFRRLAKGGRVQVAARGWRLPWLVGAWW
jgi:hypothetical protein